MLDLLFEPIGLQLEVLHQIDRRYRRIASDEGNDHSNQNVVDPLLAVQRIRSLRVAQRLAELHVLD
jgi:hypothetical protein